MADPVTAATNTAKNAFSKVAGLFKGRGAVLGVFAAASAVMAVSAGTPFGWALLPATGKMMLANLGSALQWTGGALTTGGEALAHSMA